MQVVHRELQGLETYEKIVNCKFVNYETVNYEDPLYSKREVPLPWIARFFAIFGIETELYCFIITHPLTFQYKKIAKNRAIQGRVTSRFEYLIKIVL